MPHTQLQELALVIGASGKWMPRAGQAVLEAPTQHTWRRLGTGWVCDSYRAAHDKLWVVSDDDLATADRGNDAAVRALMQALKNGPDLTDHATFWSFVGEVGFSQFMYGSFGCSVPFVKYSDDLDDFGPAWEFPTCCQYPHPGERKSFGYTETSSRTIECAVAKSWLLMNGVPLPPNPPEECDGCLEASLAEDFVTRTGREEARGWLKCKHSCERGQHGLVGT